MAVMQLETRDLLPRYVREDGGFGCSGTNNFQLSEVQQLFKKYIIIHIRVAIQGKGIDLNAGG